MRHLVLFLVLLAGCATSYAPVNIWGEGYTDSRLSSDTFIITFQGNAYDTQDKITKYAFRRCAEVSRANGFPYFTVLDISPGEKTAYVAAGSAILPMGQPRVSATIRGLKRRPQDKESYVAAEVLATTEE